MFHSHRRIQLRSVDCSSLHRFLDRIGVGGYMHAALAKDLGFEAGVWGERMSSLWFLSNVNPGLIIIQYLNGIPPINQPRGLLIQGWHYQGLLDFFGVSDGT